VFSQFACLPNAEGRKHIREHYGDEYRIFGIACTCGNTDIQVMGVRLKGLDILGDPIFIACPKCQGQFLVFDSEDQGYDGEVGQVNAVYSEFDNEILLATCAHCGGSIHELTLSFEYTVEEAEFRGPDALTQRPVDLFTYLTGNIRCRTCGRVTEILQFETA